MVWLKEQTHLPGIDIVKDHYPTAAHNQTVEITLEVILGNHPKATAQQPHWDQFPTKHTDGYEIIEDTLGSAIFALFPTRIIICILTSSCGGRQIHPDGDNVTSRIGNAFQHDASWRCREQSYRVCDGEASTNVGRLSYQSGTVPNQRPMSYFEKTLKVRDASGFTCTG